MSKPGRLPSHGHPGVLEGYRPLALGRAALPALARRISGGSRVVYGHASGVLFGYDDVDVFKEPSDGAFYGFYTDGGYANGTATKAAFPGRYYWSITPTGINGARCGDVEPGCMTVSQVVDFFHNSDHDGGKPMLYASAGTITDVELALRDAGVGRSQWDKATAHYTGMPHLCGPRTCGYGLDDAELTQWATGAYDSDIAKLAVFVPVPPPVDLKTYGAPTGLKVTGGRTSFSAEWTEPAHPGLPDVDHYDIYVYDGVESRKHEVKSYPRSQPGTRISPPDGSLQQGRRYILHVVASGPGATLVRPYTFARAVFTTG